MNAKSIDAVAKAGGTSASIPASNLSDLESAFDHITALVDSCKYALGAAPPSTTGLYVFFDGDPQAIPQNEADGWSYDSSTLQLVFHGSVCDHLQGGTVKNIDVVYGCPRPVVR